jgi:nucleoside-diphosphate-sugar epimerase
MTRVLILGANGRLARNTTRVLLDGLAVTLTLYLLRASGLKNPSPERVRIVEGDVLDGAALRHATRDQDIVYANLAGDVVAQACCIIDAMHAAGLKRLIFVSSMGIYGEAPGEKYRSVLDPYRESAALIEASDLDYTIPRPGWFTRKPEGPSPITKKGEPFQGHDIALDSLSALIARIVTTPGVYVRCSTGVSDG